MTLSLVVAVVVIGLAFDFTNGFHDAANAIATSVSTRALTPRVALVLAAVMNFVGALLGQDVAHTVAGTLALSDAHVHRALLIVLSALVGAIGWNLVTWYFGLPSSSTHALVGALVGAALVGGPSLARVQWHMVLGRVVVPLLLSPVLGFALAYGLMLAVLWFFRRRNAARVFRGFRAAQTVSAAALALGHGLQDAQKTMGVIWVALTVAYPRLYDGDRLPLWVILCAAAAISLGTYTGGWRIIRTLGRRIIDLDPARGFTAEAVGAGVLYVSAFMVRAPVSTTHTVTAAIAGSGATARLTAVRWGVVGRIIGAWGLTLPAAAVLGAVTFEVARGLSGL